MTDPIDEDRRRILGAVATAIAVVARPALPAFARAQSEERPGGAAAVPTSAHAISTSFGSLKQIDAGVLNVGYVDVGPIGGTPVMLLHGWPYDIHCYAEVAPRLSAAGYRVIVPYLRGYGTTRFLSTDTMRNGQQSAIAVDVVALMDALGIEPGDPRRLRLGGADGQR